MTKVLFVTSEYYPLIKTGGLADVSYSLPRALSHSGIDIIPILPGYPAVMAGLDELKKIKIFSPAETTFPTTIFEGFVNQSAQKIWVVDTPELFKREGGPYIDSNHQDWPDNGQRFGHFCDIVSRISLGQCELSWLPDIVHCNDWQTGLVCAYLHSHKNAPASIMTIHNLAYQGLFSFNEFEALSLPKSWWSMDGAEFHGHFSFLKAGLSYADAITTVSPTYAQEILSPEQGYGFEGLLNYRKERITGILNGADYQEWNPETDHYIPCQYGPKSLKIKSLNKASLQKMSGLEVNKQIPLIGIVSRLAHQKGMDFISDIIERFIDNKTDDKNRAQWIILGSGDKNIEEQLISLSQRHPETCQVRLGYNENLAHNIEAAADIFFMPSRYEPCGLNQIYSLKYGTIPVATKTGGLADTIINADDANKAAGTATGFLADENTPDELESCLRQALLAFQNKSLWLKLRRTAMAQDFGWNTSAEKYKEVYKQALSWKKKKLFEFSSQTEKL